MQIDLYECKRGDNTVDVSPVQDQVDTLTFQNQSLKAKADRFEEALKKNTEEQLKVDGDYNCTVIKIHVSKYDSHHAIKWMAMGSLPQGLGGRSQPRPQLALTRSQKS